MLNYTTKPNKTKKIIRNPRETPKNKLRLPTGQGEREKERVNPRSDIFSFQNLLVAYYQCRKNKRYTASAAKFELNFEKELLKLEQELKNHT